MHIRIIISFKAERFGRSFYAYFFNWFPRLAKPIWHLFLFCSSIVHSFVSGQVSLIFAPPGKYVINLKWLPNLTYVTIYAFRSIWFFFLIHRSYCNMSCICSFKILFCKILFSQIIGRKWISLINKTYFTIWLS